MGKGLLKLIVQLKWSNERKCDKMIKLGKVYSHLNKAQLL